MRFLSVLHSCLLKVCGHVRAVARRVGRVFKFCLYGAILTCAIVTFSVLEGIKKDSELHMFYGRSASLCNLSRIKYDQSKTVC